MEILLVGKRDYEKAKRLFPDRDQDIYADAVVAMVLQWLVGNWLKTNYPEAKSSYIVGRTGDEYLDGPGTYVKDADGETAARVKQEIKDLIEAEGDDYAEFYFFGNPTSPYYRGSMTEKEKAWNKELAGE